MRYWLDKGIDGFRMDVINFISKDLDFPDAAITNPDSVWQNGAQYYACGPRLHEYLQDIGKILKEYDAFSVGEMPEVNDSDEILKAVGFDRGELSMIFHFELYVLLSLLSKFSVDQSIANQRCPAWASTTAPEGNSRPENGKCLN
jgi:glycosidase